MNFNSPDEDEKGIDPGAPAPLAPEEKEDLYKKLMEKYQTAGSMDDVDKADKRVRVSQIASGLGNAFADYGSNVLAARGVQTRPTGDFFSNMHQNAEKRAAVARSDRKGKMDDVLTQDKMEWEGKERGRKEGDWKRDDATRARDDDPNSVESKTAQDLAKKLMPSGSFEGMSASQLNRSLPHLEKMYTAEQQRLGRIDGINARNADRAATREDRQSAKDDDRAWKEEQVTKANDEKKKTKLTEIEDRRTNITQNLKLLDGMIAEDGTWEVSGSHNQDMDRLVDAIATDMAKLQDPDSVARPSEVDAVKRNLVQSGFGNTNSTARDVIKNFGKEVESRADSAYNVRGMADLNPRKKVENIAGGGPKQGIGEAGAAPAATPPKVGDTKTIGDKTYERTDKGWEEK